MAKRRTGVTANTSKHMIIDAAAVYRNYDLTDERLIGATEGGVSITIEQEIREPEIDGAKGPVKGTRRIVRAVVRATFSAKEWTTENFMDLVAGSKSTPDPEIDPTTDIITRDAYVLEELTNLAFVGTKSGSDDPIVFIIKNALADGDSVELSFEDENEVSPEIQVTGHYDPADMDEEPWEIRNPIVA